MKYEEGLGDAWAAIPEEAVREISDGITSRIRFNAVVKTGVPGFIPRVK